VDEARGARANPKHDRKSDAGPTRAVQDRWNERCPCGSGKKYKSCCASASALRRSRCSS
jgi:uncharacterized protein YecA (UPF0149 family)